MGTKPSSSRNAITFSTIFAPRVIWALPYSPGESEHTAFSDASWEVRNSTSGWVLLWQNGAVAWGSRKQQYVSLSSCEAEIMALSEAAKDVIFYRKLLKGIHSSIITGPTKLATDNQGACDLSYNPEHHDKVKHIARRHFFIRDQVEAFEIAVPYVAATVSTMWLTFSPNLSTPPLSRSFALSR